MNHANIVFDQRRGPYKYTNATTITILLFKSYFVTVWPLSASSLTQTYLASLSNEKQRARKLVTWSTWWV